ncbi:MAG: hypothetical protein HKN47_05365 [Pirellulaceae bacterium]|nr:hypothetical protein [Pirellulaceae bacterium]
MTDDPLAGNAAGRIFQLQPAFRINLSVKRDDALARIRQAIGSDELRGKAESAGMCIDYQTDASLQRFWSPHLSVQISETPDGCELFCRFSPRPEIWTMFMAIYFVFAVLMAAAAIYAYVQWALGTRPWALLLVPGSAVTILGLHFASLTGQRWSTDQMSVLRERLQRTLEIAFTPQELA